MATVFLHDTFNDTTDTLLENHTPEVGGAWSSVADSAKIKAADAGQNSPKLVGGNAAQALYANAVTPDGPNQVVFALVRTSNATSNNRSGVIARKQAGANTYYEASVSRADQLIRLSKWVNGTETVLASQSYTSTSTLWRAILFECTDAIKRLIFLQYNTIYVLTSTDNAITGAGTVGVKVSSIMELDELVAVNGPLLGYDLFTDTDSTLLQDHVPNLGSGWTKYDGANANIVTNVLKGTTTSRGRYLFDNLPATKEGIVILGGLYGPSGPMYQGAIARKQNGAETYYVGYMELGASPPQKLAKVVTGSEVVLASTTHSLGQLGYIMLVCYDGKKRMVASGGSAAFIETTNNDIPGLGACGLQLNSNDEIRFFGAAFGVAPIETLRSPVIGAMPQAVHRAAFWSPESQLFRRRASGLLVPVMA